MHHRMEVRKAFRLSARVWERWGAKTKNLTRKIRLTFLHTKDFVSVRKKPVPILT